MLTQYKLNRSFLRKAISYGWIIILISALLIGTAGALLYDYFPDTSMYLLLAALLMLPVVLVLWFIWQIQTFGFDPVYKNKTVEDTTAMKYPQTASFTPTNPLGIFYRHTILEVTLTFFWILFLLAAPEENQDMTAFILLVILLESIIYKSGKKFAAMPAFIAIFVAYYYQPDLLVMGNYVLIPMLAIFLVYISSRTLKFFKKHFTNMLPIKITKKGLTISGLFIHQSDFSELDTTPQTFDWKDVKNFTVNSKRMQSIHWPMTGFATYSFEYHDQTIHILRLIFKGQEEAFVGSVLKNVGTITIKDRLDTKANYY